MKNNSIMTDRGFLISNYLENAVHHFKVLLKWACMSNGMGLSPEKRLLKSVIPSSYGRR